jgi:hypothetical protein
MDWAIVLDAFCSACENESRETSVSLPGVKRRQRVAADRDRIRRSFLKNGYRLMFCATASACACSRAAATTEAVGIR